MSIIDTIRLRAARAIAGRSEPALLGSAIVAANQQPLGPWSGALGFVPREVNPYFYEALREALAPIDGGIARLVTMDGILRVEGDNDRIVQAIERDLFASIAINDLEAGMQAFYASASNELYEQGFAVGEMIMDERGKELVGLRVADSKGIHFRRDESGRLGTWYRPPAPKRASRADGADQVEAVLRNRASMPVDWLRSHDYVQLDPAATIYAAFNPEALNPYGVSVMRSMEFVAQILLRIQNATGRVWDRFGDPIFQLVYKTANRALKDDALDKRRVALAAELSKVLGAKRSGNSADFVQALGKDDDITIKAIGSDGQIIELEMPARHVMEQILAKFGLPAWMLGMQWSTAERMAEQQSEIVLQESRTRFERRLPGLNQIVTTWLRGRGYTWNDGDWRIVQELPRLSDMLKEAQADFLRAQTQLMLTGTAPAIAAPPGQAPATVVDRKSAARVSHMTIGALGFDLPACGQARHAEKVSDDAAAAEPWAEDDPSLPNIERRAVDGLLGLWDDLRIEIMRLLGLPTAKAARKADLVWTFDRNALASIESAIEQFAASAAAEDGPLLREAFRAFARGLANAAAEFDVAAAIAATDAQMREILGRSALEAVTDATARALRSDIVAELQSGAYDGLNPREVAGLLRDRFGAHDYDWERLARSEIAAAQSAGKDAQYEAMGVAQYDWVTAGAGVCPICTGLADAGPYDVGSGPLPSRDSHPNCRCSIVAREPA